MSKPIETKRLLLRRFTINDVNALTKILSDPEVMHFSTQGPMDKQETWNFIENKILKNYKKDGFSFRAVIHKADNKLIGFCGLSMLELEGKEYIEIGYRFAKEYWGKGLATEAAQAIVNYAKNVLHLPKIYAIVDPANIASVRVLEKIGMQFVRKANFKDLEVNFYEQEF